MRPGLRRSVSDRAVIRQFREGKLSKFGTSLAVRSERFTRDKRFVLAYTLLEPPNGKAKRTDYHWVEVESGEIASLKFTSEHAAIYWQEGYETARAEVEANAQG